jgi:hypothetical protein
MHNSRTQILVAAQGGISTGAAENAEKSHFTPVSFEDPTLAANIKSATIANSMGPFTIILATYVFSLS